METVQPRSWPLPADKMDVKDSSPDQEIEAGQQPSELPNLSEKEKSKETSDHVPLVSVTT